MTLVIISIVVQVIVSVILIIWVKTQTKKHLDSGAEVEKFNREVSQLMVEVNSQIEAHISVLDDKINTLKNVVSDADKHFIYYKDEIAKKNTDIIYDRMGSSSKKRVAESIQNISQNSRNDIVNLENAFVQPDKKSSIATENLTYANNIQEETRDSSLPFIKLKSSIETKESTADKIISLCKSGFTYDSIAQKLGLTKTEIELCISMNKEKLSKEGE